MYGVTVDLTPGEEKKSLDFSDILINLVIFFNKLVIYVLL